MGSGSACAGLVRPSSSRNVRRLATRGRGVGDLDTFALTLPGLALSLYDGAVLRLSSFTHHLNRLVDQFLWVKLYDFTQE